MYHPCVIRNSCQVLFCRHLHDKFACTACTLIAAITTSNNELHHTSILGQWIRVRLLCIRKQFEVTVMLTHKHLLHTLFQYYSQLQSPINNIIWQHTHVSHIQLLESCIPMINIFLLTKRKRRAHRQCSTIFEKWDLKITFLQFTWYIHTYITAYVHTCTT